MQIKYINFAIVIAALLATASCGGESAPAGKRVEGISVDGSASNADIVRNPISASQPPDTVNVAKIVFEKTTHDFGEVDAGAIVTHVFRFTNAGKIPLLITDARSTCGCTVPEWPKTPIAPGATGEISVRFDTANRSGRQGKPITITANTYPAQIQLNLNGYVGPAR